MISFIKQQNNCLNCALIVGLAYTFNPLSALATNTYTITNLTKNYNFNTYPYFFKINDQGQALGRFDPYPQSGTHTLLWDNGKITDLGALGRNGNGQSSSP
jgi:probable HAF family extracellular repeat protein